MLYQEGGGRSLADAVGRDDGHLWVRGIRERGGGGRRKGLLLGAGGGWWGVS